MYVVAVQVSSKDSSTPDNVRPPLWPELSGAKNICVPLKPSEVTSTPDKASNSWVVKFSDPPTITNVSLSFAISKPSIVTVNAPSWETPEASISYLKSSASDEAVIVASPDSAISTTV